MSASGDAGTAQLRRCSPRLRELLLLRWRVLLLVHGIAAWRRVRVATPAAGSRAVRRQRRAAAVAILRVLHQLSQRPAAAILLHCPVDVALAPRVIINLFEVLRVGLVPADRQLLVANVRHGFDFFELVYVTLLKNYDT